MEGGFQMKKPLEVFKYLIINCETLDEFLEDLPETSQLVSELYDALDHYIDYQDSNTLDKNSPRVLYKIYRKEVMQCWNKEEPE